MGGHFSKYWARPYNLNSFESVAKTSQMPELRNCKVADYENPVWFPLVERIALLFALFWKRTSGPTWYWFQIEFPSLARHLEDQESSEVLQSFD